MTGFLAGTAVGDITPAADELKELEPFLGHTRNIFPGGAIKPLLVKVLATKTNEDTLILITADLHHTTKWLSDELRGRIESVFHIKRSNIAVCTSQTHSTPEVFPTLWSYVERFIKTIEKTVGDALDNLKTASIGVTKGYCYDVSYNNFIPITEETPIQFYPDKKHMGGIIFARDHIAGRAGGRPLDPEIGVIRIDDANGKIIAVLYNFSCHPATCIEGDYMHGDFVSFASEEIEASLDGTVAMFLQGSLGNAQSIPIFGTWEDCMRNGKKIAKEVIRVLPDAVTSGNVSMSVRIQPFAVTFIPYEYEDIKTFLRYLNEFIVNIEHDPDACWLGEGNFTINLPPKFSAERRKAAVTPLVKYCEDKLRHYKSTGNSSNCNIISESQESEIQVFRWNDIALCMNAFEMYCQTGLEIKRLSPLRYTFPVGNTNSMVGYVVPEEEFIYRGYNAFTSPMYRNCPGMIDPANCDRIILGFQSLLNEIKDINA